MPFNINHVLLSSIIGLYSAILCANSDNQNWEWTLQSINHYQSFITISQQEKTIAQYEIACSPEKEPEPNNTQKQAHIEIIRLPKSNRQVLLAHCHVGAHSQTVYGFDPSRDLNNRVIEVTGYYYASWENEDAQLWIIYDRECTKTELKSCENRFEEARLAWPN